MNWQVSIEKYGSIEGVGSLSEEVIEVSFVGQSMGSSNNEGIAPKMSTLGFNPAFCVSSLRRVQIDLRSLGSTLPPRKCLAFNLGGVWTHTTNTIWWHGFEPRQGQTLNIFLVVRHSLNSMNLFGFSQSRETKLEIKIEHRHSRHNTLTIWGSDGLLNRRHFKIFFQKIADTLNKLNFEIDKN